MILLTGAAGLSGAIVARELARQGTRFRALVHDRAKATALEGLAGIEVVEADMRRAETLPPALDDVTRALLISSARPDMVETQRTFIDAARRAGVEHIIKFSARKARHDAAFRFLRMHADVEEYLEGSGVAWTHVRPGQFMQVYFREAATIAAEGVLYLPMANASIAPVDIDDIARVCAALLRDGGHAGERLEMTGPDSLTMWQVADEISRAVGKPVRYADVGPKEKNAQLLSAGFPEYLVDALDELFACRRGGEESAVCLETHHAFGITPTSFREFARRNAASLGAQGAAPGRDEIPSVNRRQPRAETALVGDAVNASSTQDEHAARHRSA